MHIHSFTVHYTKNQTNGREKKLVCFIIQIFFIVSDYANIQYTLNKRYHKRKCSRHRYQNNNCINNNLINCYSDFLFEARFVTYHNWLAHNAGHMSQNDNCKGIVSRMFLVLLSVSSDGNEARRPQRTKYDFFLILNTL